VRKSSAKREPPSDSGRPRHRRGRLIVLLSCLAAGGLIVFLIENPSLTTWQGARFVGQVAFSPDGKSLAWTSEGQGEGRVVVWDLDHHRQRLSIGPRQSEPELVVLCTYTTVAFSPDGRTIATAARTAPGPDPRVILWDAETGRGRAILRGHSDAIIAVAFSPDGRTLASAARDHVVKLWDLESGRERVSLIVGNVPVTSIAFSPDSRALATGWGDHVVRICDVATGKISASLEGHTQAITCVAVSPDGQALASAGFDGTLRFWELQTCRERQVHAGFPNTCRSIVFAPDGKTLAIKFAETSIGALWDVERAELKSTFGYAASGLAYAPDGSLLAVGGGARGRVFLVDTLPRSQTPGPLRTNPN
jgi:WD40 repeat protein